MAIISLKAWYIPEYEPLQSLSNRPHDLRLAKNSLLKSALRADFLDEIQVVSILGETPLSSTLRAVEVTSFLTLT
jgi:hypothetical protein